ncbi:MAG: hypothetical protein WC529_02320 [Candidatus Margulisiibacteriota bacterium]
MWQQAGTLSIAAFGGSLLIHYLKNFLLGEKLPLAWDWDGVLERGAIAYFVGALPHWPILVAGVILLKTIYRLAGLAIAGGISKRNEPGAIYQKVTLKAELGLDLILSPAFAILVGIIF